MEIFTCLDAAPLRQALVFILREVEELSTEDICNVLGITRTNLGVMIHRMKHSRLPRGKRQKVEAMLTCVSQEAVGRDEWCDAPQTPRAPTPSLDVSALPALRGPASGHRHGRSEYVP